MHSRTHSPHTAFTDIHTLTLSLSHTLQHGRGERDRLTFYREEKNEGRKKKIVITEAQQKKRVETKERK